MIKKIIPVSVKNKIKSTIIKEYYSELLDWLSRKKNEIPHFEFKEIHLQNASILVNREELLKNIPENAIVAELGVDKGDFSKKILSNCHPEKLHLIDNWNCDRYHSGLKDNVENMFTNEIQTSKIIINFGLSTEVVDSFPDNYFDWIYIDTDHSYQTTLQELRSYSKKMKNKGVIAGHDFMPGNITGIVLYGVTQAVKQFCNEENWELLYLTVEEIPSFAIRKI